MGFINLYSTYESNTADIKNTRLLKSSIFSNQIVQQCGL